ncbi:hypothetical protein CLIB1444_23S00474 [[Candida] jaroonii]|uniref:Uncharacterized protein n=1 Tax=[Candida] jaroonii TaxID=467808 RepID=A0ACA9YFQ0_9ASCO|nr:hypothetical protein CLIB1444_23S00474 [[Candida] jaroonii]
MDKRRKLHSCGFCRKRKIKCDRQQPCSSCVKFNQVCSFTEEPIGRGRESTPATPRPEVSEKKDRSIEQEVYEQIHKLSSKIDALEKVIAADDGELMDFRQFGDKNSLNPPMIDRYFGPFSWVNTIKFDPVLSRLWWDNDTVGTGSTVFLRNTPSTSNITLNSDHMFDHVPVHVIFHHKYYSPPSALQGPPNRTVGEADSFKSKFDVIRKIEDLLPRPEAVEVILNIYFSTLHQCFPFIEESDFRSTLKTLINSDGTLNVQTKDGFAYLGMLLIMCKMVHVSILLDDFSLSTTFGDTLNELTTTTIDMRFMDAAQLCMNQSNLITSMTVPVFQLLALLKTYQTYGPEFGEGPDEGEGQVFTSLVLQAAYSLGIHREPTQGDDDHKDCLRRSWYHLILSDYNCFFTNGDVLNIKKFYSNVNLPTEDYHGLVGDWEKQIPKWEEIYNLVKGPFSQDDLSPFLDELVYEPQNDVFVDSFRFQNRLNVIHLSISAYFHLFNHGIRFKALLSTFYAIYHEFWPMVGQMTGKIKLLLVPIFISICQKILHINVSVGSRTSDSHLASLLTRSSGFVQRFLRYLATEYYFGWKVLKVSDRLGTVPPEQSGEGLHRLTADEDATLSSIVERALENSVTFPEVAVDDNKWLAIQGFKHNKAYNEEEYFRTLDR